VPLKAPETKVICVGLQLLTSSRNTAPTLLEAFGNHFTTSLAVERWCVLHRVAANGPYRRPVLFTGSFNEHPYLQ